jgi:hypothetical protein
MKKKKRVSVCRGVVFTRTNLGEPVFIHPKDLDASDSVRAFYWTPKQLRKMADYMEANPNVRKIGDY